MTQTSWAARLYTEAGQRHLATEELPDEGLAPVTKAAQRLIHTRLHPHPRRSCDTQPFVVMHGHYGGWGAQIHVYGVALGFAVEHGAQFVLSPNVTFSKNHWCDSSSSWCDRFDRTLQNWVRPLSSCTAADALQGSSTGRVVNCYGAVRHRGTPTGVGNNIPWCTVPLGWPSNPVLREPPRIVMPLTGLEAVNAKHKIPFGTNDTLYAGPWLNLGAAGGFLPSVLREELLRVRPGMSLYEMRYWWRAQAAAYMLRPSERTVERLAARRRNDSTLIRFPDAHDDLVPRGNADGAVRTLPVGSMSAHVRQGDKQAEHRMPGIESYFEAAKLALANMPLGATRLIFVSTEKDLWQNLTLELAQFTLKSQNESCVHSQVAEREPLNCGPFKSRWQGAMTDLPQTRTIEDDVERFLLDLMIALECDLFLGVRASNWNRLIDELRCVWVPKCTNPFYELGGFYNHVATMNGMATSYLGW